MRETFVLIVGSRPLVAGMYPSCWAAARTLDLTREILTQDGTRIEGLQANVQIAVWHGDAADAPPELAIDGNTLAGGAPLPSLVDLQRSDDADQVSAFPEFEFNQDPLGAEYIEAA